VTTELRPSAPDMVKYLDNWVRHINLLNQEIGNLQRALAAAEGDKAALREQLDRRADQVTVIAGKEEEIAQLRGEIQAVKAHNDALSAERQDAINELAKALGIKAQDGAGWLMVNINRAAQLVEEAKQMVRENL
jgi:chromosome segregation ATPase